LCRPERVPANLRRPPRATGIVGAMSIPSHEALLLPAFSIVGDGAEHTPQELITTLAGELTVLQSEREELLPTGRMTVFNKAGRRSTSSQGARRCCGEQALTATDSNKVHQ
jgi:restriction endonuclease Mrr